MSHTLLLIFFFLIFSSVLDLKEKNPGDLWHEFPHCAINAQLLYQLVQSWGWAKKKRVLQGHTVRWVYAKSQDETADSFAESCF